VSLCVFLSHSISVYVCVTVPFLKHSHIPLLALCILLSFFPAAPPPCRSSLQLAPPLPRPGGRRGVRLEPPRAAAAPALPVRRTDQRLASALLPRRCGLSLGMCVYVVCVYLIVCQLVCYMYMVSCVMCYALCNVHHDLCQVLLHIIMYVCSIHLIYVCVVVVLIYIVVACCVLLYYI
jgi:hypothetical protein